MRKLEIGSSLSFSILHITLDEEKNGYVVRDQLLYALRLHAGLRPGVPDKAPQQGHVGTRTNQGSRIDNITEKPYLHHQLGVPRASIMAY